jgi:phage shock protein PspC (stress-responsive transcriptional regulator)
MEGTCPYCKSATNEGASKCAACSSWIVDRPPVREWTRARQGKRIAGVCQGLANRFGVPVAALRLLFLGSILLGGWGILLYIALWIALPLEPLPNGQPPVTKAVMHTGEPAESGVHV